MNIFARQQRREQNNKNIIHTHTHTTAAAAARTTETTTTRQKWARQEPEGFCAHIICNLKQITTLDRIIQRFSKNDFWISSQHCINIFNTAAQQNER